MDVNNIARLWENDFGSIPPVAHILRDKWKHIWFRVYTLTDGKRYNLSRADYQKTLAHYHEICSSVLILNNMRSVLFLPFITGNIPRARSIRGRQLCLAKKNIFGLLNISRKQKIEYREIIEDRPDAWGNENLDIFVSQINLHEIKYRILFRNLIDDTIEAPIFYLPGTGAVCPYHGGIDVFLFDAEIKEALMEKYAHLRSALVSGM